jgi:hypothetical protein
MLIDPSGISLRAILVQPGDGALDHPIYFASRKLFQAERNYIMTKGEGLAMIYALQNFRHYFLSSHFKFITNHSGLKYLANKPVLEGRICQWFLLFQEFSFEVIIKLGRCNVGPDHLSRLESQESGKEIDDKLSDAYLEDITVFLSIGPAQKCTLQPRNSIWWLEQWTMN